MSKKLKPKILLIEDDPDQVLMYGTKFEISGFEVITSQKGKRGIEMAESQQPDLIVLDIVMPDIDGVEILGQLKKSPRTKDIKVVMLTNIDKEKTARKTVKMGAKDYIVKTEQEPGCVVKTLRRILEMK